MDSTTTPGLSSLLVLSRMKESLSCAVVGLVVSTCIYGITILQAYTYFRNYGRDSTHMRSFVAFLFILDTISMVLTANGIYEYVVTDFGDPLLLLNIPPSLAFEVAVGFLMAALTQCFFAHRLWALSKRNFFLVGAIAILALCSLGTGMRVSVHLYTDNNVFSFGSVEIRVLMGIANGLSAVCDVVIVAALCYYLHSKRTGFRRTDTIIDRLIIYAVNRGILTAICQTCEMITTVALPGRFVFIPFVLLGGKLYCNTLLATLNAQKSMRGDTNNTVELSTQLLNHLNTPAVRSGNHRSTDRPLEGSSQYDSTPTFVLDISVDKTKDVECTPAVDNAA